MDDDRGGARTRRLSAQESAALARELAPGERIDAWQVVRTIARGGFGSVYEVVHDGGARAALKILHAHLLGSPEMVARFTREAEVIARVRHPHVVELIAAGVHGDGRPYLCMELLDGEDLGQQLARARRVTPTAVLGLLEPVCAALALAHERGVIHRDVKASNVFVCRDGRIVLLDFGIAKLTDALALELTASREALGTPACMAPEQIRGHAIDFRADVYALGGLAFHLLTGCMPFDDSSVTMAQYLHLHARRPRASGLAPVPARVDDVIARAMAIEPAQRFSDVLTFFAALRAALRESAGVAAAELVESAAIQIEVRDHAAGADLDESLLADIETVLPTAERALADFGFALAVDLGASAIFVKRAAGSDDASAAALAVAERLDRRPRRDPRVGITVRVHRGDATFVGEGVQAGPLLRPATWGVPDDVEGVWISAAAVPGATSARRLR